MKPPCGYGWSPGSGSLRAPAVAAAIADVDGGRPDAIARSCTGSRPVEAVGRGGGLLPLPATVGLRRGDDQHHVGRRSTWQCCPATGSSNGPAESGGVVARRRVIRGCGASARGVTCAALGRRNREAEQGGDGGFNGGRCARTVVTAPRGGGCEGPLRVCDEARRQPMSLRKVHGVGNRCRRALGRRTPDASAPVRPANQRGTP